jgi:RpiB/LacA/LacB family sugar-phosphate isomerase
VRIAIGSDHAGFDLKERVKEFLRSSGVEVQDIGPFTKDYVDYPDSAEKVALEVRNGKADRGILMCGTGIGVCISANKFPGIRAALVWEPEIARLSRLHNDANILCLPGRFIDPALAVELVKIWLATPFEGGRHQRRVDKIRALEARSQPCP